MSTNAAQRPPETQNVVARVAADTATAFGRILVSLALAIALSLALAFVGALAAYADVPDPRNCVADQSMVGSPGGGFAYTVLLRDGANQPISGGTVVLDFTGAVGVILCADQDPDNDRRILGTTNAFGSKTFYVKAGGNTTGAVLVGTALDVIVQAQPRTTDFDGDLDVDASDRAALALLLGTSGPAGDYDENGIVNAADQALFEAHFGNNCSFTAAQAMTWGRVKQLYR